MFFTKEHEWAKIEGDTAWFGITAHATEQLGDITYVELPEEGEEFGQNDVFANIESVKAASDIYAPLSCTVDEVNPELENNPGIINESPDAKGWLIKVTIKDASETAALMDEAGYTAFLEEQ